MLPKKNRLTSKEVEEIFKEGFFWRSDPFFVRYLIKRNQKRARVSLVAPKSTAKSAVDRNKIRRLGYSLVFDHINHFPVEFVGVFVVNKNKSKEKKYDPLKFSQSLEFFLKKVNQQCLQKP